MRFMQHTLPQAYPGSEATPFELYRLARTYNGAACQLLHLYTPGVPTSLAPMRLCALHSIELYLAAYLRARGLSPAEVRAFRHDTACMAEAARDRGLTLKQKVVARLGKVRDNREYLRSRYEPRLPKLLEPSAIFATLDELEKKVSAVVKWERAPEGALPFSLDAEVTPPAGPSPRA
jgi:hypothetical protein